MTMPVQVASMLDESKLDRLGNYWPDNWGTNMQYFFLHDKPVSQAFSFVRSTVPSLVHAFIIRLHVFHASDI